MDEWMTAFLIHCHPTWYWVFLSNNLSFLTCGILSRNRGKFASHFVMRYRLVQTLNFTFQTLCHYKQCWNKYIQIQQTYRKAVAADTWLLHALRTTILLLIKTINTFSAVFPCAWFTFSTSDSPPSWFVSNPYPSLRLWSSTSRHLWFSPLRQLHINIMN